jgi:hypothetical protein
LFNEDCDPERDALDRLFWLVVLEALGKRRNELEGMAKKHHSISLERERATTARALRIATVQKNQLPR